MATRTVKESLQLSEDELVTALRNKGWPLPATGTEVKIRAEGARFEVSWRTKQDDVTPT